MGRQKERERGRVGEGEKKEKRVESMQERNFIETCHQRLSCVLPELGCLFWTSVVSPSWWARRMNEGRQVRLSIPRPFLSMRVFLCCSCWAVGTSHARSAHASPTLDFPFILRSICRLIITSPGSLAILTIDHGICTSSERRGRLLPTIFVLGLDE